jgi:hypothetical protein
VFNFGSSLQATRAMMQLATAYQTMTMAAGEIFVRRLLMIASGSMSATEAVNMVAEKTTTFAEAAAEATSALVKGDDPVGIANAALTPYDT